MTKKEYTRPTEGMSSSAQVAHYLQYCHSQRPGVRVKFTEIAMVTGGMSKLPRSDHSKVKSIRVSTAHIRNALRTAHSLGMHANQDGILVLDNGDDVTKYEVVPRAAQLEAARKRLEAPLSLAESLGFSDTAAGKQLKRFATRAKAANRALTNELPTAAEIRLLTTGDDDE